MTTKAAARSTVSTLLDEYGAVVRACLEGYLPTAEPRRYLYDLAADYPRRGGKMLRSSLCVATARAFGAPLEPAVRSATAIELLHNALLIHDDIEDGSEERRGRPTLHLLHGVPMAINVGDTLTLLSLRPLMDNRHVMGPHLSLRILEETEQTARESAEGQALELGWRRDNDLRLTEADYLGMVLKKTCWLTTIHPIRIGALIGTGDGVHLDDFVRFGFFLGAAFQIHDDVLNLVGDGRYGKEIDGDIQEGKRTLMLIHLFEHASEPELEHLGRLLALPRPDRGPAEVKWIRDLMDKYGSIDHARDVAHGIAGAALHEFSLLFDGLPVSRDRDFIEELATWVFERAS